MTMPSLETLMKCVSMRLLISSRTVLHPVQIYLTQKSSVVVALSVAAMKMLRVTIPNGWLIMAVYGRQDIID